jgi:hypothetical protein
VGPLALLGQAAAEAALENVAPVGERREFITNALAAVAPFVTSETRQPVVGG